MTATAVATTTAAAAAPHTATTTPASRPQTPSSHRTLTIRNLTRHPLVLVRAESLPAPPPPARRSVLGALAACIWRSSHHHHAAHSPDANPDGPNSSSDPATATATPDGETAEPLSVTIPPFASYATTIPLPHHHHHHHHHHARGSLRLTLRSGTSRFQTTLPPPGRHATLLTSLDTPDAPTVSDPALLEGIYLPGAACLAILAHAPPQRWMRPLRDDLPLSALSIPGTHNSPTCHVALPSVRCQAVDVKTQLDNGIRFLDVRVSTSRHAAQTPTPTSTTTAPAPTPAHYHHPLHHIHHPLHLVHGVFSVSLLSSRRLADLLADVYAFLDAHPSETIILSLKREGLGGGTDADLHRRLREVYCPARPERWFTGTRIPTLGEARGRIVLLRRFVLDENLHLLDEAGAASSSSSSSSVSEVEEEEAAAAAAEREAQTATREQAVLGWGTSGDAWPDNAEDGLVGGGHIRIQDYYGVMVRSSIEKKISASRAALDLAAAQTYAGVHSDRSVTVALPPAPMFLNFLSGSNFFNPACWPERIAARVNPAVLEHLCLRHGCADGAVGGIGVGDGATGVVVTDWVGIGGDWDLIKCVIAMNARLHMAEKP